MRCPDFTPTRIFLLRLFKNYVNWGMMSSRFKIHSTTEITEGITEVNCSFYVSFVPLWFNLLFLMC